MYLRLKYLLKERNKSTILKGLIWRLIERSMREYVKKGDRDLPGWERRRTTRLTTFMLMTKFQGVMIVKIGSERRLGKPFEPQQIEYLSALEVNPNAFTLPRAREG
jgi:hypothetical protein